MSPHPDTAVPTLSPCPARPAAPHGAGGPTPARSLSVLGTAATRVPLGAGPSAPPQRRRCSPGNGPVWGQAGGDRAEDPSGWPPCHPPVFSPPSPKFKFVHDYLMSGFCWQPDGSRPRLPLTLRGPATYDLKAAVLSYSSLGHRTPLSFPRASVSPRRASLSPREAPGV